MKKFNNESSDVPLSCNKNIKSLSKENYHDEKNRKRLS